MQFNQLHFRHVILFAPRRAVVLLLCLALCYWKESLFPLDARFRHQPILSLAKTHTTCLCVESAANQYAGSCVRHSASKCCPRATAESMALLAIETFRPRKKRFNAYISQISGSWPVHSLYAPVTSMCRFHLSNFLSHENCGSKRFGYSLSLNVRNPSWFSKTARRSLTYTPNSRVVSTLVSTYSRFFRFLLGATA